MRNSELNLVQKIKADLIISLFYVSKSSLTASTKEIRFLKQ